MKSRAGILAVGFAAISMFSAAEGFASQVPQAQNRIPQAIVINGQTVNGASVITASGQIQSYTCSAPQHYTTSDGRSQGWACYEETTGVWLLNALPPAQAQAAPAPLPAPVQSQSYPQAVPQQPSVIYQQPPVYRPAPVYQAPPAVVYQQPPTVIYQAPPAVIYQPATVVYTAPVSPVVVAPAYPSSVILGAAAINAAGRIASAAIFGAHYPRSYYVVRGYRRW
jgi:hypothetical protein